MDKLDLAPCPFCGSDSLRVSEPNPNDVWISCNKCHSTGASDITERLAAKKWNRRAAPATEAKGLAPEIPAHGLCGCGKNLGEGANITIRAQVTNHDQYHEIQTRTCFPCAHQAVNRLSDTVSARALILSQPPEATGTARSQEAGPTFADKLKRFGYAPGGYAIVCRQCRRFAGGCDKLATRCQPCAIAALGSQGKGAEVEAQPREGKASPGLREATKGQMMMDVAVIDKLMAKGNIYPHEEEAWRRFKAVVEADNQEGKPAYSIRDHAFSAWQKDPSICGLCGKKDGHV